MNIRGFTGAPTSPDTAFNHCDVCGSRENTRWFGNTAKIVCNNPTCVDELHRQREAVPPARQDDE